jgi:hypothetical protein
MQVGQGAGDLASYYNSIIQQLSGDEQAQLARQIEANAAAVTRIERTPDASDAVPLVGPVPPEPNAAIKPLRASKFSDFQPTKPQLSPLDEALLLETNEPDELADRRARLRSALLPDRPPEPRFFDLAPDNPYRSSPLPYQPFTAEPTIIELVNDDGSTTPLNAPDAPEVESLYKGLFARAASLYESNAFAVENERLAVSLTT